MQQTTVLNVTSVLVWLLMECVNDSHRLAIMAWSCAGGEGKTRPFIIIFLTLWLRPCSYIDCVRFTRTCMALKIDLSMCSLLIKTILHRCKMLHL